MARTLGTPEVTPGYAGLLKYIHDQATLDLESDNEEYRLSAEAFFAPGGGLDQWRILLRRKPREDENNGRAE